MKRKCNAFIARGNSEIGRKVPAGGVARHGNLAGINPVIFRMPCHRPEHFKAVFMPCWEGRFWAEAIMHGNHGALGFLGKVATLFVVGI